MKGKKFKIWVSSLLTIAVFMFSFLPYIAVYAESLDDKSNGSEIYEMMEEETLPISDDYGFNEVAHGGENVVEHNPLESILIGDSKHLHVNAPSALSMKFFYKTAEKMETKMMEMEKNGSDFSIEIPTEELWSPYFYYRLEAILENGETVNLPHDQGWFEVLVNGFPEINFQQMPSLLITELLPDSTNIGSKDGYEFIEIYNNTNQPINMKDYQILYRYPDGRPDLIWDIADDKVVPSQSSFIVWLHNSSNVGTDLKQFNEHFGLHLSEHKVAIVEASGMANSGERTIVIATDSGVELSRATYNKGGGKIDVSVNKGITFQHPLAGNEMRIVGLGEEITPGEIQLGQVPTEPVEISLDVNPPFIEHTPFEHAKGNEDLILTAKITDDEHVSKAKVFFKQYEEQPFQSMSMNKTDENDNLYEVVIPKKELWGTELIYYIEAMDDLNTTKTEEFVITIDQQEINEQNLPELLITEIVPDTTNVGKLDGYEFVEIYNNTDKPINFSDYSLRYRYPMEGREADLIWKPETEEDVIIPSGKTLVLWVVNAANTHLTVDDFNRHYGVNLEEGKSIAKMYNSGMANGSTRGLVIATNTGHEVAIAYYNEEVNEKDSAADKGIFYRYPTNGSNQMEKISSARIKATPGTVFEGQVPKKKVISELDKVPPTIDNLTKVTDVNNNENISIKADIQDDNIVKTATLYYRSAEDQPFKKVNLEENYDTLLYEYIIYFPEIIGKEKIEYYFTASDGANVVQSEKFTITLSNEENRQGLRLNVKDQEVISGKHIIKATSETGVDGIRLYIDEEEKSNTYRALEKEAYFSFEVRKTNLYFKNGVTMGDEILHIFDDTINTYTTITVPIEADRLYLNQENVITIRSGTKVSPFDQTSVENRDDFYIKNVRLVLSDGTEIYDPNFADKEKELPVGDGGSSKEFYDFSFTIPMEYFSTIALEWDTTNYSEGQHEIKAIDKNGEEIKATVIVDHSPPEITPSIEEGKAYKGRFTLDAEITDRYSTIPTVTYTLDGEEISTPFETSSAELAPGEHRFTIKAVDDVGNRAEKTVLFSVVDEHPLVQEPIENNVGDTEVTLSIKATDPTGDLLTVSFYQAYQYTVNDFDEVKIYRNVSDTEPPIQFRPDGEEEVTGSERERLINSEGSVLETTSFDQFPYHRFDVKLGEKISEDDEIEIVWKGSSLAGRKVTMYAWNHSEGKWNELTSTIAGEDDLMLIGKLIARSYMKDNEISILIQDEIPEVSTNDFTFVWMSDTQYYSASFPHIYEKQVKWIVDNKEALNIQYVFHTGDLVDDATSPEQWDVADRSMKVLDDAGIRYGVLAGNHDVGHKDGSYDQYSQYFGEDRFAHRPYYGGSYKNNRGHYDLISSNGNDFLMVYMGWGIEDEDIQWMNDVIEKYPNRKVILAFHEYLLVSGNRSPIGEKLFKEVVVPNPNVIAVLSGHYHDAQTLKSEIDDDGDGQPDRTVYQMLADYQGGPEGGQGFLRILHFDTETNEVAVKTYSPYLDQYNYYDPITYPEKDEFIWPLDLQAKEKKVGTDYFEVNVYTNNLIREVKNVESGEVVSVTWNELEPGSQFYWYAVIEDGFGGITRSEVHSFLTKEKTNSDSKEASDPTDPTEPTNSHQDGEVGSDDGKNKQDADESSQAHSNKPGEHSGEQSNFNNEKGTDQMEDEMNSTYGNREGILKDSEEESLPETATNYYILLIYGIFTVILSLSIWFWLYMKKRKFI